MNLLQEKKDHLIKRNPNLSDEEKEHLIAFFNKHGNYESKIDWNKNNSLTYKDFQEVLEMAEQSKSKLEKETKNGDLAAIWKTLPNSDYEIMFQTPTDIYVAPLSHAACVFIDSFNCYGTGAKWCIGTEGNSKYWDEYTKNYELIFLFWYNSERKEKNMFQICPEGQILRWNAEDEHKNIITDEDEDLEEEDDFRGVTEESMGPIAPHFDKILKKLQKINKNNGLKTTADKIEHILKNEDSNWNYTKNYKNEAEEMLALSKEFLESLPEEFISNYFKQLKGINTGRLVFLLNKHDYAGIRNEVNNMRPYLMYDRALVPVWNYVTECLQELYAPDTKENLFSNKSSILGF